jgi:hypothetical protein
MFEFLFENSLSILSIVSLLFLILTIFNVTGWNSPTINPPKVIAETITLESMQNIMANSFCEIHQSDSADKLDKACNELTKGNCSSVNCCAWINDSTCSAGNKNGPLFTTDKSGKKLNIENYYYQNKCYGKNCN